MALGILIDKERNGTVVRLDDSGRPVKVPTRDVTFLRYDALGDISCSVPDGILISKGVGEVPYTPDQFPY